jgi:hypothetical protein
MTQPRPEKGETTPLTVTGTQSNVSPFMSLKKGLTVFKLTYKGEGRFAVLLLDRNGRTVEQIVNTLNAFDGSSPIRIPTDGVYFLNIAAQGEYQIDVQ